MNIQEALLALGGTKESISAKLSEMGIKGHIRSACDCPIARYLMTTTHFTDITVSDTIKTYDMGETDVFSVPIHVCKWIIDFDSREAGYEQFLV